MIFYKSLIIQLIRAQDPLIQIMEKLKYHIIFYAGSQNFFLQSKFFLIGCFFFGKYFQKFQVTDSVCWPFFPFADFEIFSETRSLRHPLYKHSISHLCQVSSDHLFLSGMTDIRFQDLFAFFPVICSEHQKRKYPFLQAVRIHLKTAGTFPDIQKFFHRTKPEFHQILKDHFIINSISVYMGRKCDQLFIFRTVTANDHPACQFQQLTFLYSFKAKCLHNAHCLWEQASLDEDFQQYLLIDHSIFPIVHHFQAGIQIFSLYMIPVIFQDPFSNSISVFSCKRR